MEINYPDLAEIYYLHEKMIKIGKGRKGIRDFTLLHSAVERQKASFAGQDLYPTIWLKTAALIHSLIKNHPFNDGNKRTGYFAALRFLAINGYKIEVQKNKVIRFVVEIDTKNLSLSEIASWFEKHVRKVR